MLSLPPELRREIVVHHALLNDIRPVCKSLREDAVQAVVSISYKKHVARQGLPCLRLISALHTFPHLRHLNLANSAIRCLPNSFPDTLLTLNLSHNSITDITAVSTCTQLQSLDIHKSSVNDLSPISSCFDLRTIDVTNTAATSLQPLSVCSRLHHAHVVGINVLPLVMCSTLHTLSIHFQQESFRYSNINPDFQMSALLQLSAVTYLKLQQSGVDLPCLDGMSQLLSLRTLHIDGRSVNLALSNATLLALPSMPSTITSLTITVSCLTSIDALRGCPSLTYLDIHDDMHMHNDFSVAALTACTALQTLRVAAQRIQQQQPWLPSLTSLQLYDKMVLTAHTPTLPVLHNFGHLQHLTVLLPREGHNPQYFSAVPGLRSLHITYTHELHDLSYLDTCTQLISLRMNFSKTCALDFAPFRSVGSVTCLDLSFCCLTNITPLTAFRSLAILNLRATSVNNVSPLNLCKDTLTDVDISRCSYLWCVRPLCGLSKLSRLYFQEMPVMMSGVQCLASAVPNIKIIGVDPDGYERYTPRSLWPFAIVEVYDRFSLENFSRE